MSGREQSARLVAGSVVAAGLALASPARAEAPPPAAATLAPEEQTYVATSALYYPTPVWMLTQLVPSPEVGVGRIHTIDAAGVEESKTQTTFGLRWMVTPVLWSFGTNRRVNRWRFVVVDPLARSAGSIGLDAKIEYFFGDINRVLFRPGVHATFPIAQRGEYVSASLGTSIYQYDDTMRVSYDAGIYILYGILGLDLSYAPTHAPLRYVASIRIRYF